MKKPSKQDQELWRLMTALKEKPVQGVPDEITIIEERVKLGAIMWLVDRIDDSAFSANDVWEEPGMYVDRMKTACNSADQAAKETRETHRRSNKHFKPMKRTLTQAAADAERMALVCHLLNGLSVFTNNGQAIQFFMDNDWRGEVPKLPAWATDVCAAVEKVRKMIDDKLRKEIKEHETENTNTDRPTRKQEEHGAKGKAAAPKKGGSVRHDSGHGGRVAPGTSGRA